MVFVNDTSLMMAAFYGHCLQEMQFPSLSVTTYAGLCGDSKQNYNDSRLLMRFDNPYGITFDTNRLIYFTLKNDNVVLVIDTVTELGYQLCSTAVSPRYLLYEPATGNIWITMDGGLAVIEPGNIPEAIQLQYGGGSGIGTVDSLRLDTPIDLEQLQVGVWILVDYQYHR